MTPGRPKMKKYIHKSTQVMPPRRITVGSRLKIRSLGSGTYLKKFHKVLGKRKDRKKRCFFQYFSGKAIFPADRKPKIVCWSWYTRCEKIEEGKERKTMTRGQNRMELKLASLSARMAIARYRARQNKLAPWMTLAIASLSR